MFTMNFRLLVVLVTLATLLQICTQEHINLSIEEICKLPVQPGNCSIKVPRWYYDSETGECKPYSYSGCRGNSNNFDDYAACERTCITKTFKQGGMEDEL